MNDDDVHDDDVRVVNVDDYEIHNNDDDGGTNFIIIIVKN